MHVPRATSPSLPCLLLLACGEAQVGSTPDAGVAPDAGPSRYDPFAPLPDESEGLVNVGEDLELVLERGALDGACAAYRADPADRRKKLLCGKWMFFYETFDTGGVPEPIATFLHQNFEEELGRGYTKLGMIPDPYASDGTPLGLAPTSTSAAVPQLAFTCASCHFARLPDGRYAVGAPNHDYEYGKHIMAIMGVGSLLRPDFDPSAHHPDYVAYLEPFRQKLQADQDLANRFVEALLPLILNPGPALPALTVEEEGYYANWKAGTMDFVIAPLPVNDGAHTISKISALWDIPRRAEQDAQGMSHAMLGWAGSAQSLEDFLDGFVVFGDGPRAAWPRERFEPLAEYIYSLRAPKRPTAPSEASLLGRRLFEDKGCLDCHGGPRGSGKRMYSFEEIGTDPELSRWMDPELSGTPCCGLQLPPGESLSYGVKSPRLVGLWTARRFLHNGSVDSLESLFCLDGPRVPITEPAFGNQGHDMTCDGLADDEKRGLIEFLRSL